MKNKHPLINFTPMHKALPFAVTLGLAIALFGCAQKAEQTQAEPSPAQLSSDAANRYKQEIDGLAQIGITVETIADDKNSFNIYKDDTPTFDAKVADLGKRIKADAAIEGTEVSGQKADLLKALQDNATKNAPWSRTFELNRQAESQLKNHMISAGSASLKETAVQQTVTKLKGVDAFLKLVETDNDGDFKTKVRQMFPG